MPADALATLGARASAGMVLTPKAEYSFTSITLRVNHPMPCLETCFWPLLQMTYWGFRAKLRHFHINNKEVMMYITSRGYCKTYNFLSIYLWLIWDKGLGRCLITIKNIFFLCSWYNCIMQYISHHIKTTWIWTSHHQLHDLNILWNQKLVCHWSVINVIKQI